MRGKYLDKDVFLCFDLYVFAVDFLLGNLIKKGFGINIVDKTFLEWDKEVVPFLFFTTWRPNEPIRIC